MVERKEQEHLLRQAARCKIRAHLTAIPILFDRSSGDI